MGDCGCNDKGPSFACAADGEWHLDPDALLADARRLIGEQCADLATARDLVRRLVAVLSCPPWERRDTAGAIIDDARRWLDGKEGT